MLATLSTYLRQFWNDVRGQKLRTFLTVFGIIWGTAAVSLLLAFGEGFHEQMLINTKGLGENIVICWPASTSRPWQGLPRGRRIRVTNEDIDLVRREVPMLAAISGEYSEEGVPFRVGRTALAPQVVGTNAIFSLMRNLIPTEGGRYLNPLDLEYRRRVVFIGDSLKEDLFGDEEAVGRYVNIGGVPFLVIGTMVPKEQDSNYSGRDEDKASIPITTFAAMYGRKYVDNFIFQVRDISEVEAAKDAVVEVLARRHEFDPDDGEAILMWDTTEQLKFFDTFFLGFRLFLGIVGALTLVVGGIGVSNIMNVVVEERTKEIGIKMALGARKRYVLGQILFETLLITAAGGVIGFLIAWGVVSVVPMFGGSDVIGVPRISAQVGLSTTAVLGLIGLVAGWFPARTAANLDPVEAMRL